jgi:hypothetical protein
MIIVSLFVQAVLLLIRRTGKWAYSKPRRLVYHETSDLCQLGGWAARTSCSTTCSKWSVWPPIFTSIATWWREKSFHSCLYTDNVIPRNCVKMETVCAYPSSAEALTSYSYRRNILFIHRRHIDMHITNPPPGLIFLAYLGKQGGLKGRPARGGAQLNCNSYRKEQACWKYLLCSSPVAFGAVEAFDLGWSSNHLCKAES